MATNSVSAATLWLSSIQPQHVEIRILRHALDLVLPLPGSLSEVFDGGARQDRGSAGLDVGHLDPAGRHRRQLERERAVDEHEKDVVRRVQERQLPEDLVRVVEEKIEMTGMSEVFRMKLPSAMLMLRP